MSRYIIFNGSKSCHCCFEYTVMDSTKPDMIGDIHYESDGVKHYETVCECFDLESAEMVCNALNKEEA